MRSIRNAKLNKFGTLQAPATELLLPSELRPTPQPSELDVSRSEARSHELLAGELVNRLARQRKNPQLDFILPSRIVVNGSAAGNRSGEKAETSCVVEPTGLPYCAPGTLKLGVALQTFNRPRS
jgi:hypothetical protein